MKAKNFTELSILDGKVHTFVVLYLRAFVAHCSWIFKGLCKEFMCQAMPNQTIYEIFNLENFRLYDTVEQVMHITAYIGCIGGGRGPCPLPI